MVGDSIKDGLHAIYDAGQNLVNQGARLKSLSDNIINQADARFVSATNLVVVGADALEEGRATLTLLSEAVFQFEVQFTNSCEQTVAALGAARKSIALLSDSQNELRNGIEKLCDQTAKSLGSAKKSCAVLKADMGQTQKTVAELAGTTQRVLAATRSSLETADGVEANVLFSLTNALAQTCTTLGQAESGLESLSQTDIPEITSQLGEVSQTVRNFDGMVNQTIPVISFLGVVGIILSCFMLISGIQLFLAGRQLQSKAA